MDAALQRNGMDYHEKSLEVTARTLIGLPHILIPADIGAPRQMMTELQKHGIRDTENILHVRSFLDHECSYVPGRFRNSSNDLQMDYQGVFVDENGRSIPRQAVVRSLVEHFKLWSEVINRYGLILMEVHCLEPSVASRFLDEAESLHFDAYHSFSGQNLVEADVF